MARKEKRVRARDCCSRPGSVSAGPDDRLQLRVGLQPVITTITADSTHLETSEGCVHVALGGVDPDVAAAQLFGYPERPGGIGGEDVVVQAELGIVGDGNTFVVIVEGDGHHHRPEDLLPGHGDVVGPGDQGGPYVVAGGKVLGAIATHHYFAFLAAGLDVVEDPLLLGPGDERPHHCLLFGGVPHREEPGERGEPFDDLVEDAPVDDRPGRGRADLARVECPGGSDGGDGGLDVGVGEDDRGTFASQLHEEAFHGGGAGGRYPLAHGRGTGERHHVDIGRGGEGGGRLGTLGADQVDHPGRKADFIEDPGQRHHRQWILGGGFDDDRVAHGQGRGDLAGHVGQGKVVAGDGGHHSDRLAIGQGADQAGGGEGSGGGGDGREHFLLHVANVAGLPVESVGTDGDLHARPDRGGGTGFGDHQGNQLVVLGPDGGSCFLEQGQALLDRGGRPRRA